MIILVFMCFSIGIYALIKQEILITTKKKWKGKSTLFLSVPLIISGILLLVFMMTRP